MGAAAAQPESTGGRAGLPPSPEERPFQVRREAASSLAGLNTVRMGCCSVGAAYLCGPNTESDAGKGGEQTAQYLGQKLAGCGGGGHGVRDTPAQELPITPPGSVASFSSTRLCRGHGPCIPLQPNPCGRAPVRPRISWTRGRGPLGGKRMGTNHRRSDPFLPRLTVAAASASSACRVKLLPPLQGCRRDQSRPRGSPNSIPSPTSQPFLLRQQEPNSGAAPRARRPSEPLGGSSEASVPGRAAPLPSPNSDAAAANGSDPPGGKKKAWARGGGREAASSNAGSQKQSAPLDPQRPPGFPLP